MRKLILISFIGLLILNFFTKCDYTNKENQTNRIDKYYDSVNAVVIEDSLFNQLSCYTNAMYSGDIDKGIDFINKDFFTIMEKMFPNEFSIETYKYNYLKQLYELKSEADFTMMLKSKEITDKLNLGDTKIYIVSTTVLMGGITGEVTYDEEIIAVTYDKGLNWKFLKKDNELIYLDVLRLRFSEEKLSRLF